MRFGICYRSLLPLAAALILLAASFAGAAAEVRPFVAGSLAKIAAERQGRPFILALWSVGCTHCPAELKAIGALKKAQPRLDVVLVATDAPEDTPLTAELAAKYGLARAEQWIFADAQPERLRFEIDPRWRGELPRTHFYDARHRVEAISGLVPAAKLKRWAQEHGR